MKPQTTPKHRDRRRWLRAAGLGLTLVASIMLLGNAIVLLQAAQGPVDAYLVLGGSIPPEIYVAQLVKQQPDIDILISQGSPDPCIVLIFERYGAPMSRVWLEKCATFDNFYFSLSILRQWGVRKVQVITSPTHLPRAKWLGKIILGARGMWVDTYAVKEKGIPGNRESWLKTSLDVTRALVWAVGSHFYQPSCSELLPLTQVNMNSWQQQGFHCEHQGGLK
ncbi:MAG: YdcF family protein [Hormoscilla sp. GUM202]|nr:YdcF family protein [Hormoscilla sp. GUM202]